MLWIGGIYGFKKSPPYIVNINIDIKEILECRTYPSTYSCTYRVPLYEYIRIKIVSREYINSKGEMEEADIRPGTIPQEGNCIN